VGREGERHQRGQRGSTLAFRRCTHSPRLVRNMATSLQLDRTLFRTLSIHSVIPLSHSRLRSEAISGLEFRFPNPQLRHLFARLDYYKRTLRRASVHPQSQRIDSPAPDSYHGQSHGRTEHQYTPSHRFHRRHIPCRTMVLEQAHGGGPRHAGCGEPRSSPRKPCANRSGR
jgi:hypothetical protein